VKKAAVVQPVAEGLLMRVDRTTERVTSTGKQWTLSEIQKLVGGDFEIIRIPGDKVRVILVDQDGHPKALKPNPNATELSGQPLVGDALVVRRKDIN